MHDVLDDIRATALPPAVDDAHYLAWYHLRALTWHPAIAAVEAHHDTICQPAARHPVAQR